MGRLEPSRREAPVSTRSVDLLLRHHQHVAASEACEELLLNVECNSGDLLVLAYRMQQLGFTELSERLFRAAYRAEMIGIGLGGEPLDRAIDFCMESAGLHGDGMQGEEAPAGYLRAYFDDFAERFESRLVGQLDYRGPQETLEFVSRNWHTKFEKLCILDVGCGTGLAGPLFRPHAQRLDGLDLSPDMLAKARPKAVYDQLWEGDLATVAPSLNADYDLVIALDVLIYVRSAGDFLDDCVAVMNQAGALAISIETGSEDCLLNDRRRFSHSPAYVARVASKLGLILRQSASVSLRSERGEPVAHQLMLFFRDSDGQRQTPRP